MFGAGSALLVVMAAAALAGLRVWVMGRRASGALGTLSAALLGVAAFLMPVELAFFASIDSSRDMLDMLADVFTEPWFLVAWAGLMALTIVPASLQAASLWFVVPRHPELEVVTPSPAPPADPDPPEAPESAPPR